MEDGFEISPLRASGDSELAEVAARGVEELDPMIPRVSHGDERSVRRDSDSPREAETAIAPSTRSKSEKKRPSMIKGLDAVVIFVRDKEALRDRVVGHRSWAEELPRAGSTSPELEI